MIDSFWNNTRSPFRCFKFAFAIVNKNYDEENKYKFVGSLLELFLSRLSAPGCSINNSHFMCLSEGLAYAVSLKHIVVKGFEQDIDRLKRIIRAAETSLSAAMAGLT